jgi:two-component system, sensor histidine kinase
VFDALSTIKEKLNNDLESFTGSELDQSIEDARHIQKCVFYIKNILNNTLDMNKLKEGKMAITLAQVMLRSEVIDMILMMLKAMKSEDVEVIVNCNSGLYVTSDSLRLTQVVTNLLTNAFKFCKAGQVTIDVQYFDETKIVQIAIEDTGPGIPPEHRHKLFTKYGQIAVRQGTGLGLALSLVILIALTLEFLFQ